MIVTMHDLTLLSTETGKASTLPRPLYLFKRWALKHILSIGLRKAAKVIAVSKSTQVELIETYPFLGGKTEVIYEGVDEALLEQKKSEIPQSKTPFFLYVGNAYPHKNLDVLIDAFFTFIDDVPQDNHDFLFVGRKDFFYERLEEKLKGHRHKNRIRFLHDVSDAELVGLYRNTDALFFPSRMEGFGLPAIEAASCGAPLVVSDIPIFHEILGDIPYYVPVCDTAGWTESIRKIIADKPKHTEKKDLIERFQWKNAAKETLSVYEYCTRV